MNDHRQTANVKATPAKAATGEKPAAGQAKPPAPKNAPAGKRPGGERPSLPGERAEGEGMIAPEPADTGVEGEGSYTATHRYDDGVARTVAAGKTEELGKAAAKALDGPEGDELRAAEKAAKQGHSH
jgi:hypothetical protein